MARLIKHTQQQPYVLGEEELEGKSTIAVCACGLSKAKPYCDGSHKATGDEEEGTLYRYEGDVKEGERTTVE